MSWFSKATHRRRDRYSTRQNSNTFDFYSHLSLSQSEITSGERYKPAETILLLMKIVQKPTATVQKSSEVARRLTEDAQRSVKITRTLKRINRRYVADSSLRSYISPGFLFFSRPFFLRACSRIHCIWPFVLRNSSAAHFSMASIISALSLSAKLFCLFSFFTDYY